MPFSVWHYQIDTLPRFTVDTESATPKFTLHLPIGLYPFTSERANAIIEYSIDAGPAERIGFNRRNSGGSIERITLDFVSGLRRQSPTLARPYLDMEETLRRQTNIYFEGTITNISPGSKITYQAIVNPLNGRSTRTPKYTVFATSPMFVQDDIRFVSEPSDNPDQTWVIYYQCDGKPDDGHGFHHLRFDCVDIDLCRSDFDLRIDGDLNFTLNGPESSSWMPIIQPFQDYVFVSIPKTKGKMLESITWQGRSIDLKKKVNVGEARLLLIQFCTQGLNDLFAVPNKNYTPYRSFIQTTVQDELGTYCSRPDSQDDGLEQGYAYTFEDHGKYGLKYLWTFNGGVLALLAHDCPAALEEIKKQIRSGVLDPTIAGFGGHALPYYQAETNRYAVQLGIDIITNLLGETGAIPPAPNKVYYLDQRLYKPIPSVISALRQAHDIDYVVTDASTGFDPYATSIEPNENAKGVRLLSHYLWRDRGSGLYVLFIDTEVREQAVGSTLEEDARGKLALALRRKLFYFAARDTTTFRHHLLVYGDDADKASGTGWFDGNYAGREIDFCAKYRAALEWISAHRWIRALSSGDLNPSTDCVGTISMGATISDPIDPHGVLSIDTRGKAIHYDTWYDNWKGFQAVWLGKTLEEVSQGVEYAILDMAKSHQNPMMELAKMSFAMALQESQWNKQPVERLLGLDPNQRDDIVEPEDFVIAATLQIRNAQVYANAAVWADSARTYPRGKTYCNDGPLVHALRDLRYESDSDRSPRFSDLLMDPTGLYWDRDVLHNVVLYNSDMLLVMDQNGGRITHIFVIKDGRPYCVSGTMKAYQFLTDEKEAGANVTCDGEVLQNTVYTPNHAYVACDVREAHGAGVLGQKYNPRSVVQDGRITPKGNEDCYYPDNFNAYEYAVASDQRSVTWTYRQTGVQPDPNMDLQRFRALLLEDRRQKLSGDRGVVHHPFPAFAKTITLAGQTITIAYSGVRKGHVVANEFTVDLAQELMYGKRHRRQVHQSGRRITLTSGDGKVEVAVALGIATCRFSGDTMPRIDNENLMLVPSDGRWPAYRRNLRLQRVLTDCLEIVCDDGGDFSYEVACL